MTWVAAAVASAGLTVGAVQYFKGKNDQKKNKRPTYEIPDEVKQNRDLAQQMFYNGLPEAQKQQFLENVQRSNASALSNLSSRKAGIAGVAGIDQRAKDSYQSMLAMDSQARAANQKLIFGQNDNMANYRDQAFQQNFVNPYYERTAKNQALMGAGMQNMGSSFQLGIGTIGKYGGMGGGKKGSDNPYGFDYNEYNKSYPDFQNYNPNSVQFNPNNGMYNNNNNIYDNIG